MRPYVVTRSHQIVPFLLLRLLLLLAVYLLFTCYAILTGFNDEWYILTGICRQVTRMMSTKLLTT